ncbi:hypothetical protein GH733_002880 [Mirounga leonina]|nr:hypothetical protein GH733_002880 [Mirounga leonina]
MASGTEKGRKAFLQLEGLQAILWHPNPVSQMRNPGLRKLCPSLLVTQLRAAPGHLGQSLLYSLVSAASDFNLVLGVLLFIRVAVTAFSHAHLMHFLRPRTVSSCPASSVLPDLCPHMAQAPGIMGLLLPLVLCTLAACCRARSPPMPPLPLHVLPRGCNDSDVLTVAGFALQDINRDRKDGYILRLNRGFLLHVGCSAFLNPLSQVDLGSLFYLTLDVLETDCHVLTRKAWKDCEKRHLHRSVYGQCKAIFYVNMPARILYLPAYNCTLRPVSQRKIHRMCPDCPRATDLSDPKVLEAALESLAKYNSESTSKQYSLVQVTQASSQWVFGLSYFVEYLIRESPCTKSQASSCALQPHDSEVPAPGGEDPAVNQGPAHLPGLEESQQKIVSATPNLPPKAVPKGSVLYLPDLDDEKKPEDAEENSPVEAFPVKLDLTTNSWGESLDVSFLFLGPVEEKLVVLPFPKKAQRSAECPGPAQQDNTLILPP